MLHALHLFDCCVKQNRRGSFRDKLRQPVQTDDDVSPACFSCLSSLPTERPSIPKPGHSAHHWPGVRQMVQCLLRSALRAWSLGLRSWELGANPLAYAQWMTMTQCANVSIGLQRKGWRETFAIRVALVHTGHSQGRPFAICRWQATCMGHLLWLKLLPHQNCGHIFRPNLRYPTKVWSNQCFFVHFVGCLWAVGISYIITLYLPNR